MEKKITKIYNSNFEFTKDKHVMNSKGYYARKINKSSDGLISVTYWHFY